VATRVDEIETTVDASIGNITTVQSTLVLQVFLVLSIYVLYNGLVAAQTTHTPLTYTGWHKKTSAIFQRSQLACYIDTETQSIHKNVQYQYQYQYQYFKHSLCRNIN